MFKTCLKHQKQANLSTMQNYETKRLKQITKTAKRATEQSRVKPFRAVLIAKKSQNPKIVNIYLQLSIDGTRSAFSTGVTCLKSEWNFKEQTITKHQSENRILEVLVHEVQKVRAYLIETGQTVTFKYLKNTVLGLLNNTTQSKTFSFCLDSEIQDYEKMYNSGVVTRAVFSHNKRFVKHIKDFMLHQYKDAFMLVEDVKPIFAKDLVLYIRTNLKLSENAVIKIVGFAKRVLSHAVDSEYIDKNPFANIAKFKRHKAKIIFLEQHEVEQIESCSLFTAELQKVADCFLFCCYTGLAYCDAKSLVKDSISTINGMTAIIKERSKSKEVQAIYLRPQAVEILNRYEQHRATHKHGLCLPFISNQKMNQSLQAIERIVGLSKRLTTHVARKTAANFYVTNGASQFTVKSLMGHSSIQTTEKYYIGQHIEESIENQSEVFNKSIKAN